MSFVPRPYQVEAVGKSVAFFKGNTTGNALVILPTGSGKSVVIANIVKELEGDTVVLQPSIEILEQNYAKFTAYGYRAAIYSASAGKKHIGQVTFCMIGSVIKKIHLFKNVRNIIIDECHLVNPEEGMYQTFISRLPQAKVVGLTATPYRLVAGSFDGSMLVFLNRTKPRIFNHVIYYVQNSVLFEAGHLAKLEYFSVNVVDRTQIRLKADGSDFDLDSLRDYYRRINMASKVVYWGKKLLKRRKNLLIFCSLISEAREVAKQIPGSVVLTGETEDEQRANILMQFKKGKIRCVINVGVLTTGFDYPELETCLMSRSTMSLMLYYQIIGRIMRPHPSKESGWFVDLGGNFQVFGKIETMKIQTDQDGMLSIWNNGRQLTNVSFTKN